MLLHIVLKVPFSEFFYPQKLFLLKKKKIFHFVSDCVLLKKKSRVLVFYRFFIKNFENHVIFIKTTSIKDHNNH